MKYAIKYAEEGIVVYPSLQRIVRMNARRFLTEWPSTGRIFLPNGKIPKVGDILKQPDLARTLRLLAKTNRLSDAKDCFYAGPVARQIVDYMSSHKIRDASGKRHAGLLALEDFEEYETRVEETVSIDYGGLTVHKCGPWSQGPVFLQQLRMLEGDDLAKMGHNSADYIHLITEASKLAFADREEFYGDPLHSRVPLAQLLAQTWKGKTTLD